MDKNLKKIMTVGVFDLLHYWHINLLKKAKALWNYLIVGLQEDESVFKQKWKLPIMDIQERKNAIEILWIVDEIFTYYDLDQTENLKKYKPNIFVQWPDYLKGANRQKMLKYMKEHNIKFKIIERSRGVSTTDIVNRIIKQHCN